MSKESKRLLAIALSIIMIIALPMGFGARAQEGTNTAPKAQTAADQTAANQTAQPKVPAELEGVMPINTCFKSDTFDGLTVNYDGNDDFIVKEGENKVALTITINDEEKAKKSLGSLTLIFGQISIVNKKDTKAVFACKVTGIAPAKYQEIVDKVGNKTLSEKAKEITDAPSGTAKDFLDLAEYIHALENVFGLKYPPEQAPAEKKKDTPAAATTASSSDSGSSGSGDNGGSDDSGGQTQIYNRTVLIYMDGSDLETTNEAGTNNLLDLLRSDIPSNTKVMIVTGGTKTWHMNDLNAYKEYVTGLLYPEICSYEKCTSEQKAKVDSTASQLYEVYSTEVKGLQLWEVVSNGYTNELELLLTVDDDFIINPNILTEAIDIAIAYAPAANYDLIISNHGRGIDGFGDDELLDEWKKKNSNSTTTLKDSISIKALADALGNTEFIKSGKKFDLIGFDAGLMASEEVAYALSKYADYYVSSEETEPVGGWDYISIFNKLGENPYMTTPLLADTIASSFTKSHKDDKSTMSVVDMSKMEALNTALSKFAKLLNAEVDKNYYSVIDAVGSDSHFDLRSGYSSSNLLDLKRLAATFAYDEAFSQELRDASRSVINALSSAVISNYSNEKGVDNGGLSIYFPLNAYYEMTKEDGTRVYNNVAADKLKVYQETGVNQDYKDLAARLAVRSLAGRIIGEKFWLEDVVTVNDVVKQMESNTDWNSIVKASGMKKDNAEDPIVKSVQQLINDRITAGKISITIPDPVGEGDPEHWHYEDLATVRIDGTNPVIVGDMIEVNVSLGDMGISLGNTALFSEDMVTGVNADGTKYVEFDVDSFDQKWYTLNGQITSMYVTEVKEDGGFYGYIPLLVWSDAKTAAQTGNTQSRDDYMVSASRNDTATLYLLNVEATATTNAQGCPEVDIQPVDFVKFDEGFGSSSAQLSELADTYAELLGNADELYTVEETDGLTSIGTIYIDKDATLKIGVCYVDGLDSTYYLTDYFGNTYGLTKSNLGFDESGNPKGLDSFYDSIPSGTPEDEIMTWEKSQMQAELIRYQAAQDAKKAAQNTNTQTVQQNNKTQAAQIAQLTQNAQQNQIAAALQAIGQAGNDQADQNAAIWQAIAQQENNAQAAQEAAIREALAWQEAEQQQQQEDQLAAIYELLQEVANY